MNRFSDKSNKQAIAKPCDTTLGQSIIQKGALPCQNHIIRGSHQHRRRHSSERRKRQNRQSKYKRPATAANRLGGDFRQAVAEVIKI